jgi:hypothetical protein
MATSQPVLDLTGTSAEARPTAPFANSKVWTRTSLTPADWTVMLDAAARRELNDVIAGLRQQSLPLHMLNPADFALDACRAAMAEARRMLNDRHGFVIVDRLPLDEYGWSDEEAKAAYWLLGCILSQPVAQTSGGQIFRDIRDEGRKVSEPGVDPALTQERLAFHQDNSGNRNMPDYTGLMALYAAKEGGLSEYCSLYSLYNAMAEEAPEQLDRLFQPFYHDRQGIQAPGEADVIRAPAISYENGRLRGRFSMNKIPRGHSKAGEELDNAGRQALESVLTVIRKRDLSAKYMIERGQILFFNNREGLHHREPFTDGEGRTEKRHVIRLWFRNEGRPFFDG